jgi:hypothetical protein
VSTYVLPAVKPKAHVRDDVHRLRPRTYNHCRTPGLLDESPALRSALCAPRPRAGRAWAKMDVGDRAESNLYEQARRVESFRA